MKYGLNLSFAVKRWLEPEILAAMCKDDFNVDVVQFTWDLIDPWWPEKYRDPMVLKYKEAFEKNNVKIESSFGGLASYSFAHFLAPDENQRLAALEFFKRAVDMTRLMGVDVIGSPIGGMSNFESNDPKLRQLRYDEALKLLLDLAEYAHAKGIKKFLIEPTPLLTEFPHSPKVSNKLVDDLNETSPIPFELIVDWGHAIMEPILKEEADMEKWLIDCKGNVGGVHLQQTDGIYDRHWDFTKEGIITRELVEEVANNSNTSDLVQFLEFVYAFEETDEVVYEGVKKSLAYLRGE
ncbi:sugar phosphate isomerase/epimerase [Erysipelothrix urinaevulpis]|uniref:sugar phosphate isomerase/epimerase family protein n=1 Tax=Erysipelothrix urinaevulpis TaxID=2683717 RepID=UPI00135A290F|nr:TIM barrel protein [Erysipelothrix urinaevulpis]